MSDSKARAMHIADAPVVGFAPIAAALCLSVTGVLMFKILPLIVGSAATTFHLNAQQLGQLASSDLAGITIASLLAPLWVRRFNWRLAARVTLLLVAIGNFASSAADQLPQLLLLRFMTGLGEGTASSLALVILSDTRSPDRGFGLAVGLPIFAGVIAFNQFPKVVERWGFDGVVITLGVLALLFLLFTFWLPARGRDAVKSTGPASGGRQTIVFVALFGSLAYHVGLGALWAFIERIGAVSGLAPDVVGDALALAVLFGLVGALTATAIGARWGRLWPIALAVCGQCAALYLLAGGLTQTTFTLVACAFQLLWLFCVPYQLGMIAAADRSGRLIVLALAFQAGGVTIGPVLAGGFIDLEHAEFQNLYALCAGSLIASLAILSIVGRRLSASAQFSNRLRESAAEQ